MATEGLRLEQAPPLSIPLRFFLVAPVALVVAGALLVWGGDTLIWTRFGATTAALLHLGTLGFLASVMLGALYQMIPVVAGAPVPIVRSAHVVHVALVLGVGALVLGFAAASHLGMLVAAAALGSTFVLFVAPVAVALARAPTKSATVHGMRLAVTGLVALVTLGVLMALARSSGAPTPRYAGWMSAHIALGLVVWVGGLLTAVSFQVVPMFYLTPSFPRWAERAIVGSVALSLVATLVAVAANLGDRFTAFAALPGALGVFVLHPLATLRGIRRRRRKRPDPSLRFWQAGLGFGLLAFPGALAAVLADDSRWPVLFGWLVVWGWAGLIVHGMLTRIVPFLVWFHRFSALVGRAPVPPMRRLLPDSFARTGLGLHLATLLAGAAALGLGSSLLTRIAGVGLALTGVSLAASILRVLSHGRVSA